MGLTVYGDMISQPSRSVFLFCKVTGVPYTEKPIAIFKGEHKGEDYLKINPFGQVPSIKDDDFVLTECFSIIKYLADKHKVADHWYPAELKARAKVNEYLDWHHTGLRKGGMDICREQFLNPLLFGMPTDEEKLVKDYDNFDKILGVVEKTFLGDGDFLCGDEITIADICAISEFTEIFWFQRPGTDILANHPKLAAWKDRVAKLLNPAYDEVHQDLVKFAESKK